MPQHYRHFVILLKLQSVFISNTISNERLNVPKFILPCTALAVLSYVGPLSHCALCQRPNICMFSFHATHFCNKNVDNIRATEIKMHMQLSLSVRD